MSATSRALETLNSGLGEIRSTLAARSAQVDGIAAVASIVMPMLKGRAYEREKFEAALQGRRVALDSFYRGLFVASVSSFERFVKMFVSALVQKKSVGASKFSELHPTFQQQYIIRASQVMANVGSGSVKGIPFNFSALQRSVGVCLTDTARPPLEGDVFTILMGNPTWSRLNDVLESLGIADPFNQSFGSNASIRSWGQTSWKRNLSDAEAKLNELMDQRNLIVHAAQPITIVEQDILDACAFFEAMAGGLVNEMPDRL